ncbi:MAG TPA: efflux RND transporter periplasmic adaptor subunit [Methylocella sp.]|nr:efflux RND transporter periplasmic adaptor subunit [Methylocella sp.]
MRRELAFHLPVLALGLSAFLLAACSGKPEKTSTATAASPVQVATVAEVEWPQVVRVPGTVSAVDTAVLASRAGGWVTQVDVESGAHVAQGALLAEVGASTARGQIAEAQSRLTTAEATLKEAADDERRYSAVYLAHAISAQKNDAASQRFIAAKAEAAAATSALAVARSNLDYAEIRAPFDGIIAEKNVRAGDFAAPGAPLFVVASDQPEIRAHVGPATFGALKVGDQVDVGINGKSLAAVLTRAVAAADPRTHTHLVELHLQGDTAAPYGAYAELRLPLGRFPTLTVPATALTQRAGLLGVFVVDKADRAHFRLVRIGESREGRVPIEAGLAAGETVVVAPAADLINNSPVAPQAASLGSEGVEHTRD